VLLTRLILDAQELSRMMLPSIDPARVSARRPTPVSGKLLVVDPHLLASATPDLLPTALGRIGSGRGGRIAVSLDLGKE
jgi:hypothetical protein